MRLPVETLAGLSLAALLAGCGAAATDRQAASASIPLVTTGPAADYPMVLGAPFTVDGKTFTPSDALNYDQVGYATVGGEGAAAVSIAHRTLPLPSYVELTSLQTGKTILARVERRGPMTGDGLIELSPGAAAQLGMAGPRLPVRVRRVNPPEAERALLRSGQRVPERMETPMTLVSVLMRKLEPAAPAPAPVVTAAVALPPAPVKASPSPTKKPVPPIQTVKAVAPPAPAKASAPPPAAPAVAQAEPATAHQKPAVAAKPVSKPVAPGKYVVQVGAFSSAANAAAAAGKVGGSVAPAGRFHRVRITGFASAADAGAALAKARAAGYSDARIQRAD